MKTYYVLITVLNAGNVVVNQKIWSLPLWSFSLQGGFIWQTKKHAMEPHKLTAVLKSILLFVFGGKILVSKCERSSIKIITLPFWKTRRETTYCSIYTILESTIRNREAAWSMGYRKIYMCFTAFLLLTHWITFGS